MALLTLSRALKWSARVAPLCLPPPFRGADEYAGRTAVVAGWGDLAFGMLEGTAVYIHMIGNLFGNIRVTKSAINPHTGDRSPCELQEVGLTVTTHEACKEAYGNDLKQDSMVRAEALGMGRSAQDEV